MCSKMPMLILAFIQLAFASQLCEVGTQFVYPMCNAYLQTVSVPYMIYNSGYYRVYEVVEHPYFVKNITGSDIFCSPLWGTEGPCYTLQGMHCNDVCTWSGSNYVCDSLNQPCDMATCQDSSADHINHPQSSTCATRCLNEVCGGGPQYCNTTFLNSWYNLTNAVCVVDDPCFCRRGTYNVTKLYRLSNGQLMAGNIIHLNLSYETGFAIQTVPNCVISLKYHTVTITCTSSFSVLISKGTLNTLNTAEAGRLDIVIDDIYFMTSGYLDVVVFSSGIKISEETYEVVGTSVCEIKDCIFCTNTIYNFHCFPFWQRLLYIVLIALSISLLVMLTCYVVGPLLVTLTIIKSVLGVLLYILTCGRNSCWKTNYKKLKAIYYEERKVPRTNTEEKDRLIPGEPDEVVVTPRRSGIGALLCVTLFLLWVPQVKACDSIATIASNVQTCTLTTNSQIEYCDIKSELIFNLPLSGSKSCFVFTTDDGTPIGQLEIKYHNHVANFLTEFQYWTSAWMGNVERHKSCWTPSNWCGNRCNNMATTNYDGHGHLDDPNVIYCPGETFCERTCGCASCDCFYCDSACSILRWSATPAGVPYRVYKPISSTNNFYFTANFSRFDNTTTSNYKISNTTYLSGIPGVVTSINNSPFKFVFEGSFLPPSLATFGDNAYAIPNFGGIVKVGRAALRNSPTRGILGDIQANNANQLGACTQTSDSRSVVFDPAIASRNGVTSVTFQPSGLLQTTGSFPALIGGQLWYQTSMGIAYNSSIAPPVQLRIYTEVPFRFYRKVETVCPSITFLNHSGCFNCDIGYQINILGYSTCLPGVVLLSSEFCVSKSVSFTSEPSMFSLSCSKDTKHVTSTILATSGLQSATTSYNIILDTINVLNNVTKNSTSGTSSSDSGFEIGLFFFDDTIFGIPSVLHNIVNFIINIILFIILIVIGYYIVKYIIKIVQNKMKTN